MLVNQLNYKECVMQRNQVCSIIGEGKTQFYIEYQINPKELKNMFREWYVNAKCTQDVFKEVKKIDNVNRLSRFCDFVGWESIQD